MFLGVARSVVSVPPMNHTIGSVESSFLTGSERRSRTRRDYVEAVVLSTTAPTSYPSCSATSASGERGKEMLASGEKARPAKALTAPSSSVRILRAEIIRGSIVFSASPSI